MRARASTSHSRTRRLAQASPPPTTPGRRRRPQPRPRRGSRNRRAGPRSSRVRPLSFHLPQPRIEDLVQRVPDHREPEDDHHDAKARWNQVPPRTERDRALLERELEHRPPRDARGVAESEERQRSLREDRDRYHERGVGEYQREDVGEDVPFDHTPVRGPKGSGPLNVGTLLER